MRYVFLALTLFSLAGCQEQTSAEPSSSIEEDIKPPGGDDTSDRLPAQS